MGITIREGVIMNKEAVENTGRVITSLSFPRIYRKYNQLEILSLRVTLVVLLIQQQALLRLSYQALVGSRSRRTKRKLEKRCRIALGSSLSGMS